MNSSESIISSRTKLYLTSALLGISISILVCLTGMLGLGLSILFVFALFASSLGTPIRLLSFLLFLGFFPIGFIIARKSILPIGYGLTLDAIRAIALLLLASLLLFVAYAANRTKALKAVCEIWPFVLFTVFAFLSISWSVSKGYTIRDLLPLTYPIMLYVSARVLINSQVEIKCVNRWLYVGFSLAFLFTVVGILIRFKQGTLLYHEEFTSTVRVRDIESVYQLSPWLLYLFAIIFYLKLIYEKQNRNIIFLIISILPVLVTVSRTYILMLFTGLLFVTILVIKSKIGKLVIVCLAIVMPFFALSFDNPLKKRMFFAPLEASPTTMMNNPLELLDNMNINFMGRISIWNYLIGNLHSRVSPIVGGGLGTSRDVLKGGAVFGGTAYAHGDYVKFFSELGYIGISLFFLVLIYSLRYSRRRFKESPYKAAKFCYLVFGAGIVGSIVSSIGNMGYIPIGYLEYVLVFLAMGKAVDKA
jgi:hypothetical protein